jgi:hypothetical protein
MSKEKLFALYLAKNPGFDSETITFTRSGLRKFFNTTYDTAYKQGFNQQPDTDEYEEEEEFSPAYSVNTASVEELLGLFGMRR